MKYNIQKAIYKFAILLSIEYFINLAWIYFFHMYFSQILIENQSSLYEYISLIPRIVTIVFNIVYAFLVFTDLKINKIKSILVVLVTLFFGFIGIALFFIMLFYNIYIVENKNQKQSELQAE
jgi:glucan phosphoethanolaminetransferase (alkaline phosphatase superfamily)